MSGALATVAEAAAEGKNVVITTTPGIGTVSKTLTKLEDAGLSIGHLDVQVTSMPMPMLNVLVAVGENLHPILHNDVLNAEVLVFDGLDGAHPYVLKALTEVMTSRTLYGEALPSVKSVVVIFSDDQSDNAPKLSSLNNSVTLNVR